MISKKLTNNTYLLTSQLGHHVALVWKRDNSFISSHKSDRTYESLQEIATEFAENLTEKVIEKEEGSNKLFNYPVKHDTQFDISENPYPTYSSKEGSKVVFAAGFWVIHYNGAYRVGLSPKVSTLDEQCQGPFLDKFSANVSLNQLIKRKASEEILTEHKED